MLRKFQNQEITENDKVFYHEGLLSKFIQVPKIEIYKVKYMTSADFIKKQLARLSDREIAEIVYLYYGIKTSGIEYPKILKAARAAFSKWANSAGNKSNYVKDDGLIPSIWAWKRWHMPNGTGRIKEGQQRCLYKFG